MKLDFFKKLIPIHGNFMIYSSFLFFFILLVSSFAFITLMSQIMADNTGQELVKTVEFERLKLEASINSEIAIGLKMAGSPLIKRYFVNPADPELEKMAFEEFASYRLAFATKSIFWVNDTDKLFYSIDFDPYFVNTEDPANYWYTMTIHNTEVFNFNINYNPVLNETNLWINAPVFNDENKAIGIVGTGISLSDFINAIYDKYPAAAEIFFFNAAGEITGSKDIELIKNKVGIKDELKHIGEEIFSGIDDLDSGGIKYFKTKGMRGVAVLAEIPAIDWYIIAFQHFTVLDSLKTGMTVLFVSLMLVVFLIFMVRESRFDKARAEAARDAVISSIEYASKIQRNLLPGDNPFKEAFSDYSIIWKPRDIVGGDIYWIKNFNKGAVLCVCDCTGHGTPGALLTMLVVSTFETAVTENNYMDTAQIIWELEKKLYTVLNARSGNEGTQDFSIKDGCDLAVLFIAKDGNVSSSSGRTHIFVCDGKEVTQIKGQKIFIGEGKIKDKNDIKTVNIQANPENKFYIASDGLFDQPGGVKSAPFGYKAFIRLILENHSENQAVISEKVWTAFEKHRNNKSRVDDFELISFKIKTDNRD